LESADILEVSGGDDYFGSGRPNRVPLIEEPPHFKGVDIDERKTLKKKKVKDG